MHCLGGLTCLDGYANLRAVITARELRTAEARYQRAGQRAEIEREARNAAVRAALVEGWTHAAIAEATGLTRGRVGQIAQATH